MATAITHPLTGDSGPSGEHFLLHRSARSPGGKFQFTWTLRPGKAGPAEHRHDTETHWLEVLSGDLTVWIDGVRGDYEPGDKITIPAGARHRFKNFGKVPAVISAANSGPEFEDFVVPIAIELQRRGGKMSPRMFMIMMTQARACGLLKPTLRTIPLWLFLSPVLLVCRLFARPLPPVPGWDVGAPPPPGDPVSSP